MRALAVLLLAAAAQAQDFEKDVLPLLRTRCFHCHSDEAKKPKAGLRLDGRTFILKGSRKGPVLHPGDAAKSALYWRAALPEDDDDVMPPDGEVLKPAELDLLKNWIDNGAKFGDWLGAGGPAPTKKEAEPTKTLKPEQPATPPDAFRHLARIAKDLPAPPENGLAGARAVGARIEPVFGNLLRVEFVTEADTVTDKQVAALMPLRRHIAVLSLKSTKITDSAFATIGKLQNLVRLDVPNTAVSDKGIAALLKAKPAELRALNLYGTAVTDTTLAALADLQQLATLHVWNSKATAAGVARLRAVLPTCRVHFLRDLPKPEAARDDDNGTPRRRKKNK